MKVHLFLVSYIQLFRFARDHRGTFDGECPFYCSYSGFNVSMLIFKKINAC